MKQIILLFILFMLPGTHPTADAQKIHRQEGNPALLKGITRMNVIFEYDSMTVTHRRIPQTAYIRENVDRLNEKKAGKGAEWEHAWLGDRKQKLEPSFVAAFDAASGIQLGDYPHATYTLIFRTTHQETGHNIRVSRKSASIDGTALVVETDHPDHVICSIYLTRCKGRTFDGYDFAASLRLMGAYAAAGKAAGDFLRSNGR